MCLIAIAWQATAEYPLIVAANRDEWRERPAAPAYWWPHAPDMLAGKDLKAEGTWLGVTRAGRFAALTNFRDPSDRKSGAPTRGKLVSDFLQCSLGPAEYLDALHARAASFEGFNLLAGDKRSLYCYSSRTGVIEPVAPGLHALSNHTLDEPWPKVQKAKSAMDAILRAKMAGETRPASSLPPAVGNPADTRADAGRAGAVNEMSDALFELLSSNTVAADDELPGTGVGLEWERVLSPIMITGENYGTRCSTAFIIDKDENAYFSEWTRDTAGRVSGRVAFGFRLSR
jgi:uncharacterized protein with NRDE domain